MTALLEGEATLSSMVIVRRHPLMLSYVDSLQRKNAEYLSFYPLSVFEREEERGRILLGLLNGDPCGYLYFGSFSSGDLKVHQVCIQYDARRRLYGAALIGELERMADTSGCMSITLRCGFDLEASQFWLSLGYQCIAVSDGGVRRMRRINTFRKMLRAPLIDQPFIEPESGATSARIWSANKQVGTVGRFTRGAALADYRRLVSGK